MNTGMKKTYLLRFVFFILSLGLFLHWFIGIRIYDIGIYNEYTKPVAVLFLSYAVIGIILFFVSDFVFKKWFGFAAMWLMVSMFFIASVPTHSSGLITGYRPTKEDISILMSVLFVPISLGVFFLASRKEKRGNG